MIVSYTHTWHAVLTVDIFLSVVTLKFNKIRHIPANEQRKFER